MELSRLRHILAVARTRSFSRAAEEVHITQPALSRSIAAFEQQYGVRLFDRSRGGVSLTPAGQLVVEQAKSMILAAEDLERSLDLYGSGEAGRISIGIGPMMASVLLTPLATNLLRERPNLHINTRIGLADELAAGLVEGNVELVIGNDHMFGPLPGTRREPVGTSRLAIMVRAGHPLAGKDFVTVADLEPFPVATATEPNAGGLSTSSGAFACDNFHILRDVVIQTDCLCYSSPVFVARELEEGTLVQLDVSDRRMGEQTIVAVYRQGRTLSPAALAVIGQVKALLGTGALAD
ncbi:MAG: LysR family transcriptional regulator [Novosphingobium sp.]|nr:LysR family transcriptional regulator [Novosphingobium sp.]